MAIRKGNDSANTISGTNEADEIHGFGDDDTLRGRDGADLIRGGAGHDRIFGDAGNDTLHGEAGNDFMKGWTGNDAMHGGPGKDTMWGEEGDDTMHGGAGNDQLGAGQDSNRLFGEAGDDVMLWNPGPGNVGEELAGITNQFRGGDGFDTLKATNETTVTLFFDNPDGSETPREVRSIFTLVMDDFTEDSDFATLYIGGNEIDSDPTISAGIQGIERFEFAGAQLTFLGAAQDVTVAGGSFNDVFLGGAGNETFVGGPGNDQISVSAGNNIVRSGTADADIISVGTNDVGSTLIEGFNGEGSSGGDRLFIAERGGSVTIAPQGDGTTLFDWGLGHAVVDATGLVAGQDYFFF